jgi:hypothetical protein
MKKFIIVISFIIITFLVYTMMFQGKETPDSHMYSFDFERVDKDMWFVGNWGSFDGAYDWASLKNGILKMSSSGEEGTPYLLSKPIEIRDGDVITLKRHVKISRNDTYFAGGLAMFQTDDLDTIPEKTDGNWMTSLGDGVALIEYSYDLSQNQERPGKDVIRFLAADWDYNENYQLISPIYDAWVDETLVFDTRSSQLIYTLNDTTYKLNSYKLDRSNIRFLIHAYGEGSGNSIEMDDLTITIENKRNKRFR